MERYDVHVCMVSRQPLPNLIPIWHENWRPQEVVLLVSQDMQERAVLLQKNCQDCGCRVDCRPVDPYQIEKIRLTVQRVLTDHAGRSVALNATGGTKIMALGAFEEFRLANQGVFYIDTERDRCITLHPIPVTDVLPDVSKVGAYLRAYGYRIEDLGDKRRLPGRRTLEEWLVAQVDRLGKAVASLNWYAAQAREGLQATIDPRQLRFADFQELLERAGQADVLDLEEGRLTFPNEECRQYINGGWLEHYVSGVLQQLKKENRLRDYIGNAQVVSSHRVRNELDAAFTARNRLHLIECKTGNWLNQAQKAVEATYKLDTVRDLMGGVFGRAMLVSYQLLAEADLERCREYHISVVHGQQLQRLREKLIEWISGV